MNILRKLVIGIGGLSTAAMVGCTGISPPTTQAALARTAVDNAVAVGAEEFAPAELQAAKDKVELMNAALRARELERARNLAEAAEIDARLAEIKSRSVKAEQTANELQQEIPILRLELKTQ